MIEPPSPRPSAFVEGLKARDVTAWGEAPGNPAHNVPSPVGAKQAARDIVDAAQGFMVPPFQGLGLSFINKNQGFTLGCHMTGLQPCCS